jgi:predicted alpha/beta-hydrolase family hydrolase
VERERFAFGVGEAQTSATAYVDGPARLDRGTLILGHGAGAPQTHPWMVAMAEAIAARGLRVVTFNFLYMEARRRMPDRPPVLEATWKAAIDAVRARFGAGRLFVGGKSMGGRIATMVAAGEGVEVAGLVLLGYPLHPPGKPKQLRTAHLPKVRAPMLFIQGSRDPFGGPEELAPFLVGMPAGTRLFAIDGGDHSLARAKSAKSSGETLAKTMERVAEEIARFAQEATGGSGSPRPRAAPSRG